MCEAIERVLVVAGYRAGQNVDPILEADMDSVAGFGMDLSGFERVTPQRLDEMRELAARVAAILGEVGLPVCLALETFSSHPDEWGASVGIDVQAPGEVSVTWENPAPLRRRSLNRSGEQDWTHRDVRLNVHAAMAFGAAIADVLHAAGYDTGRGVDFDPAAVWVRPRA